MRKLLLALALLGFASPCFAQNTQCSDRPAADSTNACANTRFVQNHPILPGTITLPSGQIIVGNVSNLGAAVTMSQDCTINNTGVITCLKTNNVAFAASATIDTTNASNISSGTLPIGRLPADATTWRTATANDTILNTDCWKTVGLGGNALFTETLPVVAGFPVGCEVTVKNTDTYTGPGTGRAKRLITFPTDTTVEGLPQTMLYPQEVVRVKIVNGAWVATLKTHRWVNPTTVILCVDTSGSDSTGDGLVALATAGATCLRTNSNAGAIIQKRFDINQTTPIIAPTVGQSFTDQLSLGGQPTGGNLIQLSPNGSGNVNWSNAGPCISVGDNAELDIRLNGLNAGGNINSTCNTSNTAGIGHWMMHNYNVIDIEGGPPIFNLAGANDNAIWCDGKGIATIANGIVVGGTGSYAGNLDQNCKISWSGAPTIGITGAPTLAGLWRLNGSSSIVLGGNATVAGYTSLGPSLLSGNSTFLRSGAAAGLFTITSASQLCDTMSPCNFAWTPSDASGASLAFTGVSASYNIIGNMIFASAQLTYPVTASGATSNIGGFPFNFSASNYGRAGCTAYSNAGLVDKLLPTGATATANPINNANATITNVTLTGATIIFNCTYPVQ